MAFISKPWENKDPQLPAGLPAWGDGAGMSTDVWVGASGVGASAEEGCGGIGEVKSRGKGWEARGFVP